MEQSQPAQTTVSPPWWQRVLIGRSPKRTLIRLVFLLIAVPIIFRFVLLPIRVEGGSMMPTYKDRGINFVNRLAYLFHEPRRGDVVAIRTTGVSIMYMKRIIGLPGETIEFRGGNAFINGVQLEEPYLRFKCNWNHPPRVLESNEYYVVGDNRSMAYSEHSQGVAVRERIVGRILL